MRQLIIEQQITNRESLSLDKYLDDISRIPLIANTEEIELSTRIKKGDKDALEKLIIANLRFVISVAKQYQHQGLSLPDLINEGNLGLIKAAQRFDSTRGFKFISYAVWWIRQSILQALAELSRMVRLPLNKISLITRIRREYERLEQKNLGESTSEEVALILNTTSEIVEDAMEISSHNVSMDSSKNINESNNLYDILSDEDSSSPDKDLMKNSLCKEIERMLSTLKQHEAYVISHYYGLGGNSQLTSEEMGDEMGLSKERIRQIRIRTITKMQKQNRSKLLKGFLC